MAQHETTEATKLDPGEHNSYNSNGKRDVTHVGEMTPDATNLDPEEGNYNKSNGDRTVAEEAAEVTPGAIKLATEVDNSNKYNVDIATTGATQVTLDAARLDPEENGNKAGSEATNVNTEATKLNPQELSSYNINGNRAVDETTEVTIEAGKLGPEDPSGNRAVAEGADVTDAPQDRLVRKFSSKNTLAMVMDFSILSNSTVMLIDVIQQWQITKGPLLTTLLILLPFVMFLQLPVAILVMLSAHGNYSENTRRHIGNAILAILSLSTALMLISDLLKVKTDSVQVVVAPLSGSKE